MEKKFVLKQLPLVVPEKDHLISASLQYLPLARPLTFCLANYTSYWN